MRILHDAALNVASDLVMLACTERRESLGRCTLAAAALMQKVTPGAGVMTVCSA
jgi:hypothetical protein